MSKDIGRRSVELTVPSWVPDYAARYLAHTEQGVSIRALARQSRCHASTVLRQIRKVEARRDDPLIDGALSTLGASLSSAATNQVMERSPMTADVMDTPISEDALTREALRLLPCLHEPGAVLAVAADMEKAVVVSDGPTGRSARLAVVDRAVAEAMALKDWIACKSPGRISRYAITSSGRQALSRMMAGRENDAQGFAEAQAGFSAAGGQAVVAREKAEKPRRMRFNTSESPLAVLARRRDKSGRPFLTDDLVGAGERLREDFELAQMGPRVGQNWDRFLTGPEQGGHGSGSYSGAGAEAARHRLNEALDTLGEGLADVALRCCCYMEGMEMAEKRLGWPARSGKIVLRIALIRLRQHYETLRGTSEDLIG